MHTIAGSFYTASAASRSGQLGNGKRRFLLKQKGVVEMLEKMRSYICDQLNVDESEVNLDTNFRDDLGADSLDLYELAMNLEDEYSLNIPVEELQKMNTVGDVIRYLNSRGIDE
jgi:acyl carrier protein